MRFARQISLSLCLWGFDLIEHRGPSSATTDLQGHGIPTITGSCPCTSVTTSPWTVRCHHLSSVVEAPSVPPARRMPMAREARSSGVPALSTTQRAGTRAVKMLRAPLWVTLPYRS